MKKMSETILFFGSGPVAAASLELLAKNFTVEAVITKPTTQTEMEAVAGAAPIYTASNRQELDSLIADESFVSKVAILIDFGIIVSQQVIDRFPLGIVNSHFSLLPEWRGADPITFALLSGQPKTGVSLMLIDQGMDTGKILAQKSLPIEDEDTGASLTDKLIHLSNDMLSLHLPSYVASTLKPRLQPHPDRATYSRKLNKEDGVLDWNKPAEQLEREIRAFSSWPRSRTMLAGKDVIVTKARVEKDEQQRTKGEVFITPSKELAIQTSDGLFIIERLQPAGKNEMTGESFIAGHKNLL